MTKSYYPFKLIRYKLGALHDFDQNPVQLSEHAAKKLAEQLKRGQDLPYVAAAPPNGKAGLPLLDGHQRKHVELELNHKSPDTLVPVLVPARKMTEREKKQWIVEHRKNTGDWDFDILANNFDVPDLLEWGFNEKELLGAGFEFEDTTRDAEPQIDRAAELLKKWKCKTGDLYAIGEHRLIVGDCTDAAVVARVMGGEYAQLVIIDPPYGVSYADKNTFLNAISPANRIETPIENDHQSKEETQAMWKKAFSEMYVVMDKGAVVYCFMPQGGDQMMMMMMMSEKLEPRHELIWLKNNHVLGRVDYAYKHEPILYAWKEGGHKFYGDFQTSILEYNKPLISDLHPTTKPTALIEKLMSNSSLENEIIYDGFVGSGTTLVACQNLNRRGRAAEISPAYCAVTLERLHTAFPELEIKRVK